MGGLNISAGNTRAQTPTPPPPHPPPPPHHRHPPPPAPPQTLAPTTPERSPGGGKPVSRNKGVSRAAEVKPRIFEQTQHLSQKNGYKCGGGGGRPTVNKPDGPLWGAEHAAARAKTNKEQCVSQCRSTYSAGESRKKKKEGGDRHFRGQAYRKNIRHGSEGRTPKNKNSGGK